MSINYSRLQAKAYHETKVSSFITTIVHVESDHKFLSSNKMQSESWLINGSEHSKTKSHTPQCRKDTDTFVNRNQTIKPIKW
jgi:hypothetical protein